jgi:putative transposase
MAIDNPSWGYSRIQGALKNLGHCVARATVARILRRQGIPPSRERPMQWRTFLRAHWSALLAADFFTTEVWTVRGLVTYYTCLSSSFTRVASTASAQRRIPMKSSSSNNASPD